MMKRLPTAFLTRLSLSYNRGQHQRIACHLVHVPYRSTSCCTWTPEDDESELRPPPLQTKKKETLPLIIPSDGGVPIHLYTREEIDPKLLKQLKNLARSPIPVDYVSAMPDIHLGLGVTIGVAFASDRYICPSAVGRCIGCGVTAIPIKGLYKDDLEQWEKEKIHKLIKQRIPFKFNTDRKTLANSRKVIDQISAEIEPSNFLKDFLISPLVTTQLCSLGGGNHFLELVHERQQGQVWVLIHSGSRHSGFIVTAHHNQIARELMIQQGADTSVAGLNYMLIDSKEGQDYMQDMMWCQKYAFHNRRLMQEIMLDIVYEMTGKEADMENSISIEHNYCAYERFGQRKLWVTRKGATSARAGEYGIVPGNMGSGAYITRGKGCLKSWNSCSHGAGRKISRLQAHLSVHQGQFEYAMEGVVCETLPNIKDEAPQVYKNLHDVMRYQESLTEAVCRLVPMINVKGYEAKIHSRFLGKKPKKKGKRPKVKKNYIRSYDNSKWVLNNRPEDDEF